MKITNTKIESFFIKVGRGIYAKKYLIMYSSVCRNFNMYNVDETYITPKLNECVELQIPMCMIDSEDHKINKDMIIKTIQMYLCCD